MVRGRSVIVRSAVARPAAGQASRRISSGKAALREIYDLYPDQLPGVIRDRKKLLFDEGAGGSSVWSDLFETTISDGDLLDGQREFSDFGIETKEELYLLRALASSMAVDRVPHLRRRLHLLTSPMLELDSCFSR